MKKALRTMLGAFAIATSIIGFGMAPAQAEWDIAKAAAPFKGEQINVIFLDRPGYRAIIKLLPEFEKKTGIKVNYTGIGSNEEIINKMKATKGRGFDRIGDLVPVFIEHGLTTLQEG